MNKNVKIMQEEIWKDIPNYEGIYQVSNLGRVKSLPRVILKNGKHAFICNEKILNIIAKSNGYHVVSLRINNKSKTFKVHQLVAMAFLGYVRNGKMDLVVDHINNDRLDNRFENLQVITQRENNSKDKKNKTSKYTGVCWNKSRNKWYSVIKINNKQNFLGCFENEYEANLAYQNKLKEII